jgi:prophage regulatory protein
MPHPSKLSAPSSTDLVPVFLRLPTVMHVTGLGRSTIYRLMAEQKFPCPVQLGPRAVAWRRCEIEAWGDARPLASR